MLVLSLTYYNVITMHPFILLSSLYIYFMWPSINSYPKTRKPNFDSINNPINYCCELDGSFSGCVSLYYWCIVARYLGLFQPLSPIWRPRGKSSHRLEPKISEPRKPPDRYRCGSFVLFILYLCIVFLCSVFSGNVTTQFKCSSSYLIFKFLLRSHASEGERTSHQQIICPIFHP